MDTVDHFVMFGKPSRLMLAPDLPAVDMHVENAAAAFDHFRVDVELFPDGIRQTDGLRQVVSLNAIFDGHMHDCSRLFTPGSDQEAPFLLSLPLL